MMEKSQAGCGPWEDDHSDFDRDLLLKITATHPCIK